MNLKNLKIGQSTIVASGSDEVQTVVLPRSKRVVLAKEYKGELCAMKFANITQAKKHADALGDGWEVWRGQGTAFFVAKIGETKNPAGTGTEKLSRVQSEWNKITAPEHLEIEESKGVFYGVGSELACLRLAFAYHTDPSGHGKTRLLKPTNTRGWAFALDF